MQDHEEEQVWKEIYEKTRRGELQWRIDEHRRCATGFKGTLITLSRFQIGSSIDLDVYHTSGPLRLHSSPGMSFHRILARKLCDLVEEQIIEGSSLEHVRKEKAQSTHVMQILREFRFDPEKGYSKE